jgi:energy-coupling factor transporter transmembrane protein EcfT
MNDWPKGWRFWLLVVLLFIFPVVFHPWWLFALSAAAYALLVFITVGTRKESKVSPKQEEPGSTRS